MVKYFIHCTYRDNFHKIMNQKILKTSKDMGYYDTQAKNDVVYLSFYNPENWNNKIIKSDIIDMSNGSIPRSLCILLNIRDVIKIYKYYFIAPYWDYGMSPHKISSKLHKLVQKSINITQLEINIINDKQMSKQCKYSLLKQDRLDMLFRFKGKENISIKKFIGDDPDYDNYEICFFDNIDFGNMKYITLDKFNNPHFQDMYKIIVK
ncbi:putative ORFan [Tupanvirus deep ocean]|uniref:ORFan n=2 Tax=Tupanvirus TaxID=2094720 RepID=A0AC62A9V3_9VIRU|nr:putative ORFan [Tupanvirus deep ocean]QKU34561.1 putative ORFan [Tupanvirus deep ocean]